MKDSVIAKWKEGMAFEVDVSGHKLLIDAKEEVGGADICSEEIHAFERGDVPESAPDRR